MGPQAAAPSRKFGARRRGRQKLHPATKTFLALLPEKAVPFSIKDGTALFGVEDDRAVNREREGTRAVSPLAPKCLPPLM